MFTIFVGETIYFKPKYIFMFYRFYLLICSERSFEMDNVKSKLELLLKNRNVKYGVPFIVLIIGGSFGLKEFAKLR